MSENNFPEKIQEVVSEVADKVADKVEALSDKAGRMKPATRSNDARVRRYLR